MGFTTAAARVHELMEARDERRLLNLQRQLSRLNFLIVDELGFVPLSSTGAELLRDISVQQPPVASALRRPILPSSGTCGGTFRSDPAGHRKHRLHRRPEAA